MSHACLLAPEGLDQFAQRREVALARGVAAPGEADDAHGRLLGKFDESHPSPVDLRLGADLGQKGDAVARCYHLHDGRERGRAKRPAGLHVGDLAELKRLIAQAVTLLQQQQALLPDAAAQITRRPFGSRLNPDGNKEAGDLFRLMTPDEQSRLMDNIAEAMRGVPQDIVCRQIVHFYLADKAYGLGVADRMGLKGAVMIQAAE